MMVKVFRYILEGFLIRKTIAQVGIWCKIDMFL